MSKYSVAGVPIAAVDIEGAVALITKAALEETAFEVHLCNAYTIGLTQKDARLFNALRDADLNVADGAPVAWLGRTAGITGPIRGSQLFRQVCEHGRSRGIRHFLYGGSDESVTAAVSAGLSAHYPGLQIVGQETPPFMDIDIAQIDYLADRVRATRAQIVWVGLGTPKQDYVTTLLVEKVSCAVVPVGAAFDFVAGRIREAPQVLHGTGLEWLYRLFRDPKRLWRRYTLGNVAFLKALVSTRARLTVTRNRTDSGHVV